VSADFDSSTVMTPSLPTFSIASAIRSPIVLSFVRGDRGDLGDFLLSLVDLEMPLRSFTTRVHGRLDAPLEAHRLARRSRS